jgi:isoaspartyl peptidase/L-asparaginase-like protein (Ntn-hydrolase superfamily)
MSQPPVILTHGGVGASNEWSDGCEAACRRGARELTDGGPDAVLRAMVEAAVVLEDDPRFNAGTGSNFRVDGSVQQDAMVAHSDGRIGAVACLDSTKNPVRVAQLVMDTPHVMLCGDGATAFARHHGHAEYDCSTEESRKRHDESMRRLREGKLKPGEAKWQTFTEWKRLMTGTIGAVARDAQGRFAVSCSTGGTSLMLRGRIGDSPIFGAGVMVGPHGAVCCTGQGEEIIRQLCATRCYQRMEQGQSAKQAAEAIVAAFPQPYTIGIIAVGNDSHAIAATGGTMASFALVL